MEQIQSTDDIFKRIWKKIKPQWRAAFFGSIIIGLMTYMYTMTNNFLTYDSMWNLYSDQDMITSGRQFLTYACGISSFYSLPWLNGVLAIFYLGIAAAIVTEGFEIKSKMGAVLVGGLLVTFPAISSTFCYMYTVDGYMLAVLFAALAFFADRQEKMGVHCRYFPAWNQYGNLSGISFFYDYFMCVKAASGFIKKRQSEGHLFKNMALCHNGNRFLCILCDYPEDNAEMQGCGDFGLSGNGPYRKLCNL